MSGKQSSLKDISCSVILSILNLQILILDIHKGQALFTTSNIVSSGVVSALTAALTPTCTFRCTYCCSKGSKWLQVSSTRPWNYLNFVHYVAYNTHTDTSSCPQPQLSAHTTLSPFFCSPGLAVFMCTRVGGWLGLCFILLSVDDSTCGCVVILWDCGSVSGNVWVRVTFYNPGIHVLLLFFEVYSVLLTTHSVQGHYTFSAFQWSVFVWIQTYSCTFSVTKNKRRL